MVEVFLGREALGDGLPRHELRRWYRPMFRGVYVPKWAAPSLHDRAVGAWLTSGRTGVITGVVASALHGARWVDDGEPIEILVDERRRQPGLIPRMDRVADDEMIRVTDLPVTTPARTAFDLGRYQKRSSAIGRLDALMRAAPFRDDEVLMLMRRYGPVRGVRQLRSLLPLVDAGAESLKESSLRLLLIDNGFPIPETQIPVSEGVEPFAYLDMGWRDLQLAVEYDGDQHRSKADRDRDATPVEQPRQQVLAEVVGPERVEPRGWRQARVEVDLIDRNAPQPWADGHAEHDHHEDQRADERQPMALEAPPDVLGERNRFRLAHHLQRANGG